MTHFNPAIEALLKSKPKSKSDRKARRKALAILYGAERRERHERRSTKRQHKQQPSAGESFARFLFSKGKGALDKRAERKRAIKDAEFRINREKRNAGYHRIDDKATHREAVREVDRGIQFIPESFEARQHRIAQEQYKQQHDPELKALLRDSNKPETTITGKPKNVIVKSETE